MSVFEQGQLIRIEDMPAGLKLTERANQRNASWKTYVYLIYLRMRL